MYEIFSRFTLLFIWSVTGLILMSALKSPGNPKVPSFVCLIGILFLCFVLIVCLYLVGDIINRVWEKIRKRKRYKMSAKVH